MQKLEHIDGVWYLAKFANGSHKHNRAVNFKNLQEHIDTLEIELRKARALQSVLEDRKKEWRDD